MDAVDHYWKTLGDTIASRLPDVDDIDDGFSPIASDVLLQITPPAIEAAAVAAWVADADILPTQVNVHSGFGQPPLVVYNHPQFYIEVLFWFPSRTGIHGHGFSGAFRVLNGYSIHVEYAFEQTAAPHEAVRLGRLTATDIQFIGRGTVYPISPRDTFIHVVEHWGNPSLTLVVRTPGRAEDEQFSYHRCGFAHRSRYHDDSTRRQADVLIALARSGDRTWLSHLMRLLERIDDCRFCKLLQRMIEGLGVLTFHNDVFPIIRERFQQTRAEVCAAVAEDIRSREMWTMVKIQKDARKKFQLGLSELFPERSTLDALLRRCYPNDEPEALLGQWEHAVTSALTSGIER